MSAISRRAELSDLPELLRLEAESFSGDRLSRRSLRRLLQSPTALCLVVDGDAGRLAGYALWLYRSNSTQARLYSVAVDACSQGQGVGRLLLTAGATVAAQRGCERLSLEVKTDNHGALYLYKKLGFEEVGRRHRYYDDGTDALRLVKRLGATTDNV